MLRNSVLFICLRATLPINELKGKPPTEVCPILNLHRCIYHNYYDQKLAISISILL